MRIVTLFGSGAALLLSAQACSSSVTVFGEDPSGAGGSGGSEPTTTASTWATGPGSGGGATTTTGVGGSGASGAGGSTLICDGFGDPCTSCASTGCPDTWCQCANNPECLALFGCYQQCMGDEGCEQDCLTEHEDGISDVILVSGCAGTVCQGSCNFGNPEFNDCQDCIYNDCAAEMNACIALPDCAALWGCLDACPNLEVTCQQQCYDDFGDGAPPLEVALMCVTSQCGSVCQ